MGNIINPQEIHEAINAADDALIALRRAEKSLSGASGWGLWDLLGGGFFSDLMKHSKIDQAQSELQQAQAALGRFRKELADIDRLPDINLDIGDFLRIADYIFDGIFADGMMQMKISKGRQQVQEAILQIENIRSRLWAMLG